jgi:hypothetical protein
MYSQVLKVQLFSAIENIDLLQTMLNGMAKSFVKGGVHIV